MRDEHVNALQNVGAALFIIGFAGNQIFDGTTQLFWYIISVILMVTGIVLIGIAQWVVIEEDKRKEQKNKCHRTAKHTDTYY